MLLVCLSARNKLDRPVVLCNLPVVYTKLGMHRSSDRQQDVRAVFSWPH